MRKNPWNKHQILEKWDDFENRPSCKGYRLCKMVSLGQKLECPKTCQKRICKHITVVLWKNPLEKTPIIRQMRWFWKSVIFQRLQTLLDGQCLGPKLKSPKNWEKRSLQAHYISFVRKNHWKKQHQIFEKWDDFENRPSCKGYRLCKMVSLGQKLKIGQKHAKNESTSTLEMFCAKIRCKKTPIIREMRRFWKSAILQRL